MNLQLYMPNGQTIQEYVDQQIQQSVKKALREAWEWDHRNFPPYGDGILPHYLKDKQCHL